MELRGDGDHAVRQKVGGTATTSKAVAQRMNRSQAAVTYDHFVAALKLDVAAAGLDHDAVDPGAVEDARVVLSLLNACRRVSGNSNYCIGQFYRRGPMCNH